MSRSWRLMRQINAWLRRQGVRQPLLRRILTLQVFIASLLLLTGLALAPLTNWFFWLGVGAILALWNFLRLTKIVPHFMVSQYTPSVGFALFIRSQVRLLLLVSIGGLCVIWLQAPVGALLTGFSLILVVILWGVLTVRSTAHGKK